MRIEAIAERWRVDRYDEPIARENEVLVESDPLQPSLIPFRIQNSMNCRPGAGRDPSWINVDQASACAGATSQFFAF